MTINNSKSITIFPNPIYKCNSVSVSDRCGSIQVVPVDIIS